MFNIHAITAVFSANDEATVEALMDTKPVRKALASSVRGNSDYIVTRGNETPVDDILNITIKVVDRSYTMANSQAARDAVLNVINQWAQKSRVAGIRGDRLAIVSDLVQTESTEDNDTYDIFEASVNIGTAVFYNPRRVTVNYPNSQREFAQDLTNLLDHLKSVGAIDSNTGVIVESELYGEFHAGNTELEVEDDNSVTDCEVDATISEIGYLLDNISVDDDRDSIRSYLEDIVNEAQSLINEIDERG